MEVQQLVENLKRQLPFLKRYSDEQVLKYHVQTGINNLKEERDDTDNLLQMFKERNFVELEEKLENKPKLLELLNIFELITA